MKKNMLFGMLLMTMGSLSLSAQTPGQPVKTGDEWKMPGDAIKRSRTFADNLKKQLGLNTAQTNKVYEAYLANTKPLDEIGVLPITDKEKENRRKSNKAAFDETLKGVLTKEQFDKYNRMNRKGL